jgi:hypothetical protein
MLRLSDCSVDGHYRLKILRRPSLQQAPHYTHVKDEIRLHSIHVVLKRQHMGEMLMGVKHIDFTLIFQIHSCRVVRITLVIQLR